MSGSTFYSNRAGIRANPLRPQLIRFRSSQQIDSSAISSPEPDPLDFVMTTVDDAVNRINNEYFFRRDTSEICRQSALTGELQVLTPQQFKTALAGRWVEAENPKTGKMGTRDAATVWLESRSRREVLGIQYCPKQSWASSAASEPLARLGHASRTW